MNKNQPAVLITESSIVLILNSKRLIAHKGHPLFSQIKQRIKDKNYDGIEGLFNVKDTVEKNTGVVVKNNSVYFKNELLSGTVVNKILQFVKEGFDYQPLCNFLNNLMENPSFNSRQQLYTYMEKNEIPITESGTIIFFKALQSNFTDKHTGKFYNNPGTVLKIDRSQCDDNPNNYCSNGFHTGSFLFVKGFGSGDDVYVTCEVNPRDVVSVPNDANCSKLRVCEYKVIEQVYPEDMEGIAKTTVVRDYNSTKDNYKNQRRDNLGRFVKS